MPKGIYERPKGAWIKVTRWEAKRMVTMYDVSQKIFASSIGGILGYSKNTVLRVLRGRVYEEIRSQYFNGRYLTKKRNYWNGE